jgi:hypothetical protein
MISMIYKKILKSFSNTLFLNKKVTFYSFYLLKYFHCFNFHFIRVPDPQKIIFDIIFIQNE